MSDREYIEYKKKWIARRAVTRALRTGELCKAEACEVCDKKTHLQAHHCDYGRTLDVIWLCSKCHGQAHSKGHELNPENHSQTPTPLIWEEQDYVTVSITLPIRTFAMLKNKAGASGKTFSTIIRQCIENTYPKKSLQMEFDFGKEKSEDKHKKLSCVETHARGSNKSLLPCIWKQRGGGNTHARTVA